ncbi:hypothetical protein SCP_0405900 [Sparassis crispa]|uniref:Uncharacterized protein n=1 Tax=Sparassis crispa TaxID=139825 RepID=A0A401GJ47_9APHY|nr:hypothetical protein SCP_0405900 [Sparassis crispa]GBE82207.1 hypothetical protein SCP_0405900 [Sparassis crispa]
MAQEGGGSPSWMSDVGCVVSGEGGRIVDVTAGCVVSATCDQVMMLSWHAPGVGGMVGASSWARAPGTIGAAWCIGDAGCTYASASAWRILCASGVSVATSWACAPGAVSATWCVSDAERSRASASALRTLGTGGVLVTMSVACTVVTAGFIAQLRCVGALGATCAVGRSVAQTARHIGVGLSWACAPHAGDVVGMSFASCAVAVIVQLHCGAVLVCVGATLLWSRTPHASDVVGTSFMSCITTVMHVHTLRCSGVTHESISTVGVIGCPVRWVHGSGTVGDGRVGIPRAFCFLGSCSW